MPTVARPERPPLATAICFYEAGMILLVFAGTLLLHWLHRKHSSLPLDATPVLRSVASWVTKVLAIVAAVLLWQMRRAAAHLLAGRAFIGLVIYISILLSFSAAVPVRAHRALSVTTLHRITGTIGLVIVSLNFFIAWYVFRITSNDNDNLRVLESSDL